MDELYDDIVAQIKESQVKLGYAPQPMRLYYKADGLESRLHRPVESLRATVEMLSNSPELQNTPLGPLLFRPSAGRLEVTISAEGVRYVHEQVPASPFLVDMVNLFGHCGHARKEQVLELFNRYGSYVQEDAPAGADFDFQIRFDDADFDPYVYCFKDEEAGMLTYHRLTPRDYQVRTAGLQPSAAPAATRDPTGHF